MKPVVAVLGPGAVGGSLAARLSLSGVQTICVGRPETIGIIALAGVVVEAVDETLTARPEVAEHLERPVDLLLVTVKAPVLEEALERVESGAVAGGIVLPLLNGLEHMAPLRSHFDGRVAAGTVSQYQAYRAGRVQIVETTPPPLVTIASDDLVRSDLESAAEILGRAEIEVRIGTSEKRVLWHKLVRMAPLVAATAASGRTVGDLREDRSWRQRLEQALEEACAVARAEGVPLNAAAQWTIIDDMARETTTSAARDVAAGRRSELDAITGAVLRAAERHGVSCPALNELAAAAGL